ncbi:MAG: Tm-1-like ATP-binding domain-containing protein [Bacteroidia bacterium]|nr:Tm-1-like ATP-binding domain-containing protein [Bacteroidia bacterium]
MSAIFIIGTCDTKSAELLFIQTVLEKEGVFAQIVDVSTQPHIFPADISNITLAGHHPLGQALLNLPDRGEAITAMSEALRTFLLTTKGLAGVIGIGGSGGTSLITHALKALPVGLPKIMVSTMASGNTRPFVEATDIMMVYSVTDLAGLNSISRTILANAAQALAGVLNGKPQVISDVKPALGMTMFGVTTPCVQYIRSHFEDRFDCVVFHATGIGGQSFEKLVSSGMVKHVIDVTLTEVCDHLMGGILSAGESRLDAFIQTRIPYIGSVGALDMVNFGSIDSVPEHYRHRNLYKHNAAVTLMRTTPEENVLMGKWIAAKLNRMEGPVRFFLPEKGVSLIDSPGKPFYDPEADHALFDTLEKELIHTENRRLIRLPYEINDPAFAEALIESFNQLHHTL